MVAERTLSFATHPEFAKGFSAIHAAASQYVSNLVGYELLT